LIFDPTDRIKNQDLTPLSAAGDSGEGQRTANPRSRVAVRAPSVSVARSV
jgi:hypothetical protein